MRPFLLSCYKYNNKIILVMFLQKSRATVFSKMEAAFVASSTLKRNRRYFDVQKVNGLEFQSQVKRRRPVSSAKKAKDKISHSFSNSTAAFTERLDRDIDKFRSRFEVQQPPARRSGSQQSSKSARAFKGIGIGQNLSREQYYKVRSKPVFDERLFNNYSLDEPDITHTCNLGRGPERDFDNSLKHINDIPYETQQLYENVFYKRTTLDCRFSYKKQKQEQRQFFITARPQNKPSTDLSPQAVRKAETVAIKRPGPVDSFYMNSGRQLPCQLDARTGTKLTSHWRNNRGSIQRPKLEYSVRCMKQRLQNERKEKIKSSKKPHFNRQEICDKKFFLFSQA